jgi:SAM-dependent methyltransferase
VTRDKHAPDRAQIARLEACPWVAKVGTHRWLRHEIALGFGRDLFSSAGVDVGTLRLLRVLERAAPLRSIGEGGGAPLRILDLGCGIGSIGLSIAASYPPGSVHVTLADRDKLAIYVTTQNAAANGLLTRADRPVTILPAGLDFEPARAAGCAPFDLIVTNVPAKVGRLGLERFLFGAGSLLKPGGYVATVHVTPLTDTIDELLESFQEQHGAVESVYGSRGAEHFARVWRFEGGLPEPERGDALTPYLREDVAKSLSVGDLHLKDHLAAHDVEEFDTAHFQTPLLAELLQRQLPAEDLIERERILVVNPAHGFLAELLLLEREPATIALASRDTLELAIAKRNLEAFAASEHLAVTSVELAPTAMTLDWLPAARDVSGIGYDLIVGPIAWKEGHDAVALTLKAYLAALSDAPEAALVLAVSAGQAQALRRIARENGLRASRDLTRKGYTAVLIRKAGAAEEADDEQEGVDDFEDEQEEREEI